MPKFLVHSRVLWKWGYTLAASKSLVKVVVDLQRWERQLKRELR